METPHVVSYNGAMLAARPLAEKLIKFRSIWLGLALAATTLLTYWPVTRHEFTTYDDPDYVTRNTHVQAGLCARTLAWVWSSDVARNWHPVTMLSHALDWQLFGAKAGGHHFTSLLFHITNTLLLFRLLNKLTGAFWRPAFVAALFALHPLHVESVAWIAERKDVLSTCFFLLTLIAYVNYVSSVKCQVSGVRDGGGPKSKGQKPKPNPVGGQPRKVSGLVCGRWSVVSARSAALWYFAALLLFALGLMSKPMLVTVPLLLLLLDYWPLNRVQSPKPEVQSRGGARVGSLWSGVCGLVLEKVPFIFLSLGSSIVTFLVQQRGGSVLDLQNLPLAARISNALISYVRYLGKMLWPEQLTALYLRKGGWPDWEIGLAALILIAVTGTVLWVGRNRAYLITGWFWYLVTLVPVIGLVQVGMQTMADRYTYIPLIGIFLIAAWGTQDLLARTGRTGRTTAVSFGAAVLLACCVATGAQLVYWKDAESLLQRMISVNPANYMAHYNLGNLYDKRTQPALAIEHYRAAIAAEPNYAEAHCNLGSVLLHQARFGEAVAEYETATHIRPDSMNYFNLANTLGDAGRLQESVAVYQQALRLDPGSGQAHHNLGLVLQKQGQNAAAIAEFRAATESQPDLEVAQYCLANLLAETGNSAEAVAHFLAAERLNPGRAESYNGLGICYGMEGKYAEAEQQLRRAVILAPDNAGAQSNLGNALGAQNKLAEAIPHYEKALQINPKDFQTHYNLAVSLIRQGKSAEAKSHLQQALDLHPDYPEAKSALASLAAEAK